MHALWPWDGELHWPWDGELHSIDDNLHITESRVSGCGQVI